MEDGQEEDQQQQECTLSTQGDTETCPGRHDRLEERPDPLDYDNTLPCNRVIDMYQTIGYEESLYQTIEIQYNEENDDRCLVLDGTVHTCASIRPHYHEIFVHYSARFIASPIKRVIFIGGGDSMVLHEILKYPSLELVVGLELDQAVVRRSFKHFGTQPHFDDERVEWWFGDATKSLLMLPKEYYGSFDLVLVDLTTK